MPISDAPSPEVDASPSGLATLIARFRRSRIAQLIRFGSVGVIAYVVDVGIFNFLLRGPGEALGHKPLTAKLISAGIATIVAWIGNRYWTFSHHKTDNKLREVVQFLIINLIGMGIATACLAVSRYVLHMTSPLADNISANIVGLILGTIFRYFAYKKFVFTKPVSP